MRRSLILGAIAVPLAGAGGGLLFQADSSWTERFAVDRSDLRSTGRNPWFVLEPGYQLVLEHGTERLTITVLAETRLVDGVETRVVEERETDRDVVKEVSRNYFAICARTNSVFYFGEDVDIYQNGRVASHEGAWLSGEQGARFGLAMPGLPLVPARYYQEIAPQVAMDRARIVRVDGAITTPAGAYSDVLEVEETTPLEPAAREAKLYAPGVGLVRDGDLTLVRATSAAPVR